MVQERKRTIFISAAETSGDHHAARLVEELLKRHSDWRCVGIGGDAMARAGCHLLENVTARSAMLAHALGQAGFYWRLLRRVKTSFNEDRPDVVVLVDSPAWNFHLAKAARKMGLPILHYIAPQLWAWGAWRVNKLRRLTDHVACILPFETEWFRRRNIPATFVGHPLFDDSEGISTVNPIASQNERECSVVLLPGSRRHEVEKLWPIMQRVVGELIQRFQGIRIRAVAANEMIAQWLQNQVNPSLGIEIRVGGVEAAVRYADLALVASGTATLEVAAQHCPMIVMYHVPWIQWRLVGRWIIKTPYISLVNIIAQREIVPEFIPIGRNTAKVVEKSVQILDDESLRMEIRRTIKNAIEPIGKPGAAANTAVLVEKLMPIY